MFWPQNMRKKKRNLPKRAECCSEHRTTAANACKNGNTALRFKKQPQIVQINGFIGFQERQKLQDPFSGQTFQAREADCRWEDLPLRFPNGRSSCAALRTDSPRIAVQSPGTDGKNSAPQMRFHLPFSYFIRANRRR